MAALGKLAAIISGRGITPRPQQPVQRQALSEGEELTQRQESAEEEPFQAKDQLLQKRQTLPVQKQENRTGLPDNLKAGVEHLSGLSLDDVRVHYNSSQPAQLQALAYTRGAAIHVAPGQEHHVPHEAWHVVQQKQGRVAPTRQLKGKVSVNDDEGLEKEATEMGAKAIRLGFAGANGSDAGNEQLTVAAPSGAIVQRVPGYEGITALDIEDEWVDAYLDDLYDQTTHYEEVDAIDYIGGPEKLGKLGMQRDGNHYNINLPDGQMISTRSDGNCVIQAVYLIQQINQGKLVIENPSEPPDVPAETILDFQTKLYEKLSGDRGEVRARIARQMKQSATVAETGFGPRLMALISPRAEQVERERLTAYEEMRSRSGPSGKDPDINLLSSIRDINHFFAQQLKGMMSLYDFFDGLKDKMTTAPSPDIMSACSAQLDELDHLLKFGEGEDSLEEIGGKADAISSISFTSPSKKEWVTKTVKLPGGQEKEFTRLENFSITDQEELKAYLLDKIKIVQALLQGESWQKYISRGFLNYSDFNEGGVKKDVLEGEELLTATRDKCLNILEKIAPLVAEFDTEEQDQLYEEGEFEKGVDFNLQAYLLASQTVPGSADELRHTLSDTSNINSCMNNAVSFVDKLGACPGEVDTKDLLASLKQAERLVSQGGYAVMAVRIAMHGVVLLISKDKVFEVEAAAAGDSERPDQNSILGDIVEKIEKGEIEGIPLDKYIAKLEAAISANDRSLLEPEFTSDEPNAFFSLTWNLALAERSDVPLETNMKEDVEVLAPPRLVNLEHFMAAQDSMVKKLGTIL